MTCKRGQVPRDSVKQQTAIKLTAGLSDSDLLRQVACEFGAVSCKSAPFGLLNSRLGVKLRG